MNDIEEIRKSLFAGKFSNEIKSIEKQYSGNLLDNFPEVKERYMHLKSIDLNISAIGESNENIIAPKDKELIDKMVSVRWSSIYTKYKIIKIDEYLSERVPDKKFKKLILNKLSIYAINKCINKKAHVVYDKEKRMITDIPILKIDNLNKKFKINLK